MSFLMLWVYNSIYLFITPNIIFPFPPAKQLPRLCGPPDLACLQDNQTFDNKHIQYKAAGLIQKQGLCHQSIFQHFISFWWLVRKAVSLLWKFWNIKSNCKMYTMHLDQLPDICNGAFATKTARKGVPIKFHWCGGNCTHSVSMYLCICVSMYRWNLKLHLTYVLWTFCSGEIKLESSINTSFECIKLNSCNFMGKCHVGKVFRCFAGTDECNQCIVAECSVVAAT